ncbi:MFS general substrate transporter [Pholiota conissans]|uniref:MFS general substrate transporter n=1 Tax=Pholiota conissans TaxID=109636 RepID=A0A9P5ZBJ2_9AGAR|nr:MFS general substrate transporter [Pholiota conissans]
MSTSQSEHERTLDEVQVSGVDELKYPISSKLVSAVGGSASDAEKGATSNASSSGVPDGGLRAWSIVVGSILIQFCGFGYTTAFGVYQGGFLLFVFQFQIRPLTHISPADYYTRVHITNTSSSAISWIGSINAFILIVSGLYAGPLFDRGYFYYLLYGGAFLTSFSLFMLSLTQPNHFYQNLLTHGIGLGLGGGMLYVPSIAIISQYFHKKRTLAMTFVASGSSLGAVIHPIMLNNLFTSHLGFQGSVRASAGLVTGVLVVACILLRPRFIPKSNVPKPPMWKLARKFYSEWGYTAMSLGGFFFTIGFYFPVFYLQLDSIKHGRSERFSFYVLVILNGCSFLGRLAPGLFIHSIGVVKMIVISASFCSALIFAMIGLSSLPSIVTIAILYGFFSGIFVTLQAPLVAVLTNDMSELGARMGVAFTCVALGALVGPPIHGALLTEHFIWWRPGLESGIMALTGTVAYTSILFATRKGQAPKA